MSGVLSSFFDNKFIIKRNDSSHRIKKIILTQNLKSSKLSLSENNIKNPYYRSSRHNNNKVIRKNKAYNFNKYKFLKNISKMLKNNEVNDNINNNINIRNPFFFKFNHNNNLLFFSNHSKINKECDKDNNIINNDNSNSNIINLSTDIINNKNLQNDIKLLPIKSFNSCEKKKIKENQSRDIRVNKIINSLINSNDDENYKSYDSYFKKEENNKNYYPKEKMIDPIYYIKYNINSTNNPKENPFYKGFNNIIKEITNGYSNKEYSLNLLKRSREVSNSKIEIDHLNVPNSENNIYKKKYEDMINQTKHFKSFHFNKNSFLQKKLKQYSPYKNILDKTYKFYLDNQFKDKEQNIDETNRNWSKRNIKLNLKKNIYKFLSFDTRVNNILNLSKNTERNVNEKSKMHKKMINDINKILNSD